MNGRMNVGTRSRLDSMHPFFGDISYAFRDGSPFVAPNPLALTRLDPVVPFSSHGYEGALLGTEKGIVVPYYAIRQADPLVISMKTQEGFIYDWILSRRLDHLTRVTEEDPEPMFLTIAYGNATVIRSLPHCAVRDRFQQDVAQWVEVDVPLAPDKVRNGISFCMRVIEEFPIPDKPSLLSEKGGALICYTGLESSLWLSRGAFEVVDPNLIHYGFRDGQLDVMGRLVHVYTSFPRIPLQHRIVQAVMYDGRTVRVQGQ